MVSAAPNETERHTMTHRTPISATPSDTITGLWWLSFADETGHLGVAVIVAPTFLEAVERSHEQGLNFGGQVMGLPISSVEYATDGKGA